MPNYNHSREDGPHSPCSECKRMAELEAAIKPFADIADEYEADGLDEARLSWVSRGLQTFDPDQELFSGRGGKRLITLGQVYAARDALKGLVYTRPVVADEVAKIRQMYEASMPNLAWEQMSEQRRQDVIDNYKKLLK